MWKKRGSKSVALVCGGMEAGVEGTGPQPGQHNNSCVIEGDGSGSKDPALSSGSSPCRPVCFRTRPHYFLPNDIVWIRPPGFPYWPAEVVTACVKSNRVTARLFDPPTPLASSPDSADLERQRDHVSASANVVYFFDRLRTPEEVEECIEQRLQRAKHDVSSYESAFHRAVLRANRLVRIVLSPEKLQPYPICGVGVVYSLMRTHVSAPRQPNTNNFAPQTAVIRLRVGLENAVRDLKGFEFIWVLFSFSYALQDDGDVTRGAAEGTREGLSASDDVGEKVAANVGVKRRRPRQGVDRSLGFKTMIVPPRDSELRGVFATRSPHRPNFIGLSCVRLVDVRGLEVHIADHDLLHGTPVLDIKPYLPFCDAHPEARSGWVAELDASGRGGADHKSTVQTMQVDRLFEDGG
uniref:Uncharacterized protein TCIL3000_7_1870 n=1 Tax=Trypanosoma congolense (strain IL3000) TaxID=1068625 RepID=G0UPR6_TRYCI|nr:unnamed protein product [Trypanosoma congolense IL3000]